MAGVAQSSTSVAEICSVPQWYARGIIRSKNQWRRCGSLLPCLEKNRLGDNPGFFSDHGDLQEPTASSSQPATSQVRSYNSRDSRIYELVVWSRFGLLLPSSMISKESSTSLVRALAGLGQKLANVENRVPSANHATNGASSAKIIFLACRRPLSQSWKTSWQPMDSLRQSCHQRGWYTKDYLAWRADISYIEAGRRHGSPRSPATTTPSIVSRATTASSHR